MGNCCSVQEEGLLPDRGASIGEDSRLMYEALMQEIEALVGQALKNMALLNSWSLPAIMQLIHEAREKHSSHLFELNSMLVQAESEAAEHGGDAYTPRSNLDELWSRYFRASQFMQELSQMCDRLVTISERIMNNSLAIETITQRHFDKEEGECLVCLDEFEIGEETKMCRNCELCYHAKCIEDCLIKEENCPHCTVSVVN